MLDHVAELKLRRLRAGELDGSEGETTRQHLDGCAECKAKLRSLESEERAFQEELSFDRFSAGVTRAMRKPAPSPIRVVTPLLALAAAVLLSLPLAPLLFGSQNRTKGDHSKGGAEIVLQIAPASGQQQKVDELGLAPVVLGRGDRIKIGYKPGAYRYLLSISIDEQGLITPLYPDDEGESIAMEEHAAQTVFLPQSWEFTGRGAERLIVVVSNSPLRVEEVKRAAKSAYDSANGDVLRMKDLQVAGTAEFNQTLLKP